MPDFSAARRQQVREITVKCRAQLLIARQMGREDAARYRVQAERFKALAADTSLPKIQGSQLRIAAGYERLAQVAEATLRLAELAAHPAQGSEQPTRDGGAAQSTLARARRTILQHDDRRVATAALLALSRSLCHVSAALTREAREKLRDSPTADRLF